MAARSHEAVQSRAEIAAIYAPIEEGLARVIGNLKGLAKQQSEFLGVLLDHVFETPGKSVRPALTLLAGQFHPHDGSKTETMATAVELLHIATLIHDDTVDRSDVRRGRKTINSLWGGNTAVLLGDYLFRGLGDPRMRHGRHQGHPAVRGDYNGAVERGAAGDGRRLRQQPDRRPVHGADLQQDRVPLHHVRRVRGRPERGSRGDGFGVARVLPQPGHGVPDRRRHPGLQRGPRRRSASLSAATSPGA